MTQPYEAIRSHVGGAAWRMSHEMLDMGLARPGNMRPTRTGILLCGAHLVQDRQGAVQVWWDRDKLLDRTGETKDAAFDRVYEGPRTIPAETPDDRDPATTDQGISMTVSRQEATLMKAGHTFEPRRDRHDRDLVAPLLEHLSKHGDVDVSASAGAVGAMRVVTSEGSMHLVVIHGDPLDPVASAHEMSIDGERMTVATAATAMAGATLKARVADIRLAAAMADLLATCTDDHDEFLIKHAAKRRKMRG